MNELKLIKPSKNLQSDIWNYRQECFDYGETRINGSCGISFFDNFDEWLQLVLSIEKDKSSRENIHASTFFSLRKSDNKIIGSIQFRHTLTEELKRHGGHIGYEIRPSERRKGYAKQQLLLVLDIARQMRIPKVMISCDKDNISSARTAISCGGVLTWEGLYKNKIEQIYWIDIVK